QTRRWRKTRGTAEGHAELAGPATQLEDLGRAQERLGRDAAPVQADAAELLALDARDLHAELRAANRRDITAGAAADDDEVVAGHWFTATGPRGVRGRRRGRRAGARPARHRRRGGRATATGPSAGRRRGRRRRPGSPPPPACAPCRWPAPRPPAG